MLWGSSPRKGVHDGEDPTTIPISDEGPEQKDPETGPEPDSCRLDGDPEAAQVDSEEHPQHEPDGYSTSEGTHQLAPEKQEKFAVGGKFFTTKQIPSGSCGRGTALLLAAEHKQYVRDPDWWLWSGERFTRSRAGSAARTAVLAVLGSSV